ncbi:HPr-rel-A system PqqD family peptide chaperone [Sphingorhabdus buctiana]|uniref:HPr-rel-A system PqqD family peptide chaperone n=1 Tax=Sphingorhabdus buctiana TaxID=1508805 RepID=A0ABW4MCV0_9SPHN
MGSSKVLYRAEPADQRLVEPLDMMTLIYQRRSGITHMVGEPVPQMLAAMGDDAVDAAILAKRLAKTFDLGGAADAVAVLSERLEELAELGLVERITDA